MRVATPVLLCADDDRHLRILSNRERINARVQMRIRIVLQAAQGMQDKDIAAQFNIDRRVVARWRARFLAAGVDGLLQDATRTGRPRTAREEANVEQVIRSTRKETPEGSTRWSTRTMAAHCGVSASTVARIWRAHGLRPHRVKSFKPANAPRSAEKLEDIVNLFLNPPEQALVLCCDEKMQIQALDRTQPDLPLNSRRSGAITLFAALDMLSGEVISMTDRLHRHPQWLRFLQSIHRQTPKNKQLHLIVDHYAMHKHCAVMAWLAKHPRFHLHFTPCHFSWLNLVERFFQDISDELMHRGAFTSVPAVESAINTYIAAHNANPKPFTWTAATAGDILGKATRTRRSTADPQP
ncbi:IS630 family transposase [Verminephrobacter aporrectodeae]|uniref:IS630 family transposase n=1 Tax=Verminephrobacter aporrectodeae TaxID=1110389 RepID=UPI0022442A5A|nr:IS630 family transposase [Verminephrobacter aporrectodeae]MCW8175234.1 IS630 family transposase [Verminephrobacter aporrectodeae subsp. tuberculatae]MCW8202665.1 IS630 family transposase [Verminephrobacter aporrectodeae subsp. tuberculatae]